MFKWFGKKEEKKQVLTAKDAYKESVLRNEEVKRARRQRLIDGIIGAIKYGNLSLNCNQCSSYYDYFLDPRDISYFESLGYKIEQKERQDAVSISTCGETKPILSTYYVISWDLNKN